MMKIGLFLSLSHALNLRSEKVVENQLIEEEIILDKVDWNRSKECKEKNPKKKFANRTCDHWNKQCKKGLVQKDMPAFDEITKECCYCKNQLEIHRELNGTDETIKAAIEKLPKNPEREDKSCYFEGENLQQKFMENLDWSAAQGRTLQHGQTIPFHYLCKMGFSSNWYYLLTCKEGTFRIQDTTATKFSQLMYGWRHQTWTSICEKVELSKDHTIEKLEYKNLLHSINWKESSDADKKKALTLALKSLLRTYGLMKTHLFQFDNQSEIRLKYGTWVDNLVEECVEFKENNIRLKEGNPDCGHEMEREVVLQLPFISAETETIDSKNSQKKDMDKLFDSFAASQKGGLDMEEESASRKKMMASFMSKTMKYLYDIDTAAAKDMTDDEQEKETERIKKEMMEHMQKSKEEYVKKEIHLCIGTKGRGSLRFMLMPSACSDDENFLGFEIMSIVKSNESKDGPYEITNHLFAPYHKNSDRQIKAGHYTNKIYSIYEKAAKHFIEDRESLNSGSVSENEASRSEDQTPNRMKLEHNELDHIEDLLKFPIGVPSMVRDKLISTKDLWMRMKKKDGKDGKWEDKVRLLFKADEGILDVMHDRSYANRVMGKITKAWAKTTNDQAMLNNEINLQHMESKDQVWRQIQAFTNCKKCDATWEFISANKTEKDHRYKIMYTFNKRKKYFGELFLNNKANEAVGYIKLCGLMKLAIEYLENKQEIIEQRFDTWVTRFKKVATVVMSIVTSIITAGGLSAFAIKEVFSIISGVGKALGTMSNTIANFKLYSPMMDVISHASFANKMANLKLNE